MTVFFRLEPKFMLDNRVNAPKLANSGREHTAVAAEKRSILDVIFILFSFVPSRMCHMLSKSS